MPAWLPSVVVVAAAVACIVWLVERVAPGAFRAWLAGDSPARAPQRSVSRQRAFAAWAALGLVVVVLVWLLYYVFAS